MIATSIGEKQLRIFKDYFLLLDNSNLTILILPFYLLLGALLIRYGVVFAFGAQFSNTMQKPTWREAWRIMFPRNHYFSASSIRDAQIFVFFVFILYAPFAAFVFPFESYYEVNKAITAIVLKALQATSISIPKLPTSNGPIYDLVYSLALLVWVDLGYYLAHRYQHTNKYLWEFHKVHHASDPMTPLSNYRGHITGYLNLVVASTFAGVFNGLFYFFVKTPPSLFAIGGFLIVDAVFLVSQNFGHSHLWFSFGKLEKWIHSPAMHSIHHSRDPKHFNKNFTLSFSVWDRVFGTLYMTEKHPPANLRSGIDDGFDWNGSSFWSMVMQPFYKCYELYRNHKNESKIESIIAPNQTQLAIAPTTYSKPAPTAPFDEPAA